MHCKFHSEESVDFMPGEAISIERNRGKWYKCNFRGWKTSLLSKTGLGDFQTYITCTPAHTLETPACLEVPAVVMHKLTFIKIDRLTLLVTWVLIVKHSKLLLGPSWGTSSTNWSNPFLRSIALFLQNGNHFRLAFHASSRISQL